MCRCARKHRGFLDFPRKAKMLTHIPCSLQPKKKRIIKDIHTIYGYGLREEVRSRRSTYELNEHTARKSSCRLLPFPSHFFALPFLFSLSPSLLLTVSIYETDKENILRKIYTRSKMNTQQAPNA